MKTNVVLTVAGIVLFSFAGLNAGAHNFETKASCHETVKEPELTIENWMLDEKSWSISANATEMEIEAPMQAEPWMIDSSNFETTAIPEEKLSIENWMTNESSWNLNENTEKESPLVLEQWMVSEKSWNL